MLYCLLRPTEYVSCLEKSDISHSVVFFRSEENKAPIYLYSLGSFSIHSSMTGLSLVCCCVNWCLTSFPMSLSFTSETESSGCQARTSVRPSALLLPSKENHNNLFPCFAFRTLFSISLFHRYLPFYRICILFPFLIGLVRIYVIAYYTWAFTWYLKHLYILLWRSIFFYFWKTFSQPPLFVSYNSIFSILPLSLQPIAVLDMHKEI